jgi:hypothetical protein
MARAATIAAGARTVAARTMPATRSCFHCGRRAKWGGGSTMSSTCSSSVARIHLCGCSPSWYRDGRRRQSGGNASCSRARRANSGSTSTSSGLIAPKSSGAPRENSSEYRVARPERGHSSFGLVTSAPFSRSERAGLLSRAKTGRSAVCTPSPCRSLCRFGVGPWPVERLDLGECDTPDEDPAARRLRALASVRPTAAAMSAAANVARVPILATPSFRRSL